MTCTLEEASQLLTVIRLHHGNAPIDPDMVRVFHAELDPRNSMTDMRRAIRDFYATSEGKWMSAAAMNRLCKQYRASRLPDEATMCRLLEADGISDPDAELRYRRTLVHHLANNETPKQARERAITAAHDKTPTLITKDAHNPQRTTNKGITGFADTMRTMLDNLNQPPAPRGFHQS